MIQRIVLPRLGRLKVAIVRHADIEEVHRGLKDTPYRANRTLALLSKMFSLAMRWEWRQDNPVRGVERYPEERRTRHLSQAELVRLSQALANYPNQTAANAVRFLLLTGARKGEALAATWDQFDLERGVWTKSSAHTKQKKEHRVPLNAAVLALLAEQRARAAGEHVFPGRRPGQPLDDVKSAWAAITSAAELEGIRIHDLRHSYASILASAGLSLPIIGALLGHTQPATTSRYAHLFDDPLREATERVGAFVSSANKEAPEVVALRKGQ
jgi:integrase